MAGGEEEVRAAALQVLLVDPQPSARTRLAGLMEPLGHTAHPVADWAGAERVLRLRRVDVVVMAFAAGALDGRKAAQALRLRRPPEGSLPLVGTGPFLRPAEEKALWEAGFDRFVFTPFAADALEEGLRAAVRDRLPPVLLDDAHRAALRLLHGPAALAALDDAAMEVPARVLAPLLRGGQAAHFVAAAAEVAAAMEGVGAIHAVAAARRLADNAAQGRRFMPVLAASVVATRSALRQDRMTAARQDPIWASTVTSPGDPT